MNRIRSFCFRRASKTPLMPSPGRPNIVSTPHASRRSTSMSDASLIIVSGNRMVLSGWTHGRTRICWLGFDTGTDDQDEGAPVTPLEDSAERGSCRSHQKDESQDVSKKGCRESRVFVIILDTGDAIFSSTKKFAAN